MKWDRSLSQVLVLIFFLTQSFPGSADPGSIPVTEPQPFPPEIAVTDSDEPEEPVTPPPQAGTTQDFLRDEAPISKKNSEPIQTHSTVTKLEGNPFVKTGREATADSTSFKQSGSNRIQWNFSLRPLDSRPAVSHLALVWKNPASQDLSSLSSFLFQFRIPSRETCDPAKACFQVRFEDAQGERAQFSVTYDPAKDGSSWFDRIFSQAAILAQTPKFDFTHMKEISFLKIRPFPPKDQAKGKGLPPLEIQRGIIDIQIDGLDVQGEKIAPGAEKPLSVLPGLAKVRGVMRGMGEAHVTTLLDNKYFIRYDVHHAQRPGMEILYQGRGENFSSFRPFVVALRSPNEGETIRLIFDDGKNRDFVDLAGVKSAWQFWGIDINLLRGVDMTDIRRILLVSLTQPANRKAGKFVVRILVDTTPPAGSVKIAEGKEFTNSRRVDLSLKASDAQNGVTRMAFSEDGITFTPPEAFRGSRAFELKKGEDGERKIFVKYFDTVGNESKTFSDSIVLDQQAPTGTISINHNAARTSSPEVTLDLNAQDAITPAAKIQMAFSQDGIHFTSFEPFKGQKKLTLQGGEGSKKVTVRYRDQADNFFDVFNAIILDHPPTEGSLQINQGASHVNSRQVTLNLAVTDKLSPDSKIETAFSEDGSTFSVFEPFSATKSFTLSEGADGLRKVFVRFRDEGENVIERSDSIILDRTVPAGKVVINQGASHTNSERVNLMLDVSDNLSPDSKIQVAFSEDGVRFSSFRTYDAHNPFSLTGEDGIKAVFVRYRDEAGNVATVSDTILLDRQPPAASIAINEGSSSTSSRKVTLKLLALDNLTSLENLKMAFSQDGVHFTPYEPFRNSRSFTLTRGNGKKKVFVRFRDEAGNVFTVSDSIVLK